MVTLLGIFRAVKGVGYLNILHLLQYRFLKRIGWYRLSCPVSDWHALPAQTLVTARSPFSVPTKSQLLKRFNEESAAAAAGESILSDKFLYFGWLQCEKPPQWNKWQGKEVAGDRKHWSAVREFGDPELDVKWVWESSRFEWVYVLGRAWVWTGDDKYRIKFWTLLADWRAANPPNLGVHWKCAQECSLRLVALVWAVSIFGDTSPEKKINIWEMVCDLAKRIEKTFDYSLYQENNHILAEALALYLAGWCLPDSTKSKEWKARGKNLLMDQVRRQFDKDGSYFQNSFNYARFALRLLTVSLYCAEKNGDIWPKDILDSLRKANLFLIQFQDPQTGHMPNYGHNDGSHLMHLSSTHYSDFRPTCQLLSYLLDRSFLYERGGWDEELLWLFGADVLERKRTPSRPPLSPNTSCESSGYYRMGNEDGFGVIRCHSYKKRPGQADLLHLDLWYKGVNFAIDCGSYSYNDSKGWGHFLKSTAAHNTVTVEHRDQMTPFGKFLWIHWPKARCLAFDITENDGSLLTKWVGEHDGYQSVTHRRTAYFFQNEWLIIDDLSGDLAAPKPFNLRWNLGPGLEWIQTQQGTVSKSLNLSFTIFGPGKTTFVPETSALFPMNGHSFRYGEMKPHALLQAEYSSGKSVRWITHIGRIRPEQKTRQIFWKHLVFDVEGGIV